VGIGQGETQVTPIQLLRAISGIASDGHFVRPHFVSESELPADFYHAVLDSFPGSGEKAVDLNTDTWMTITDGMAAATTTGTAAASHIEGVDFAGKTGTAQVVGGGDTHVKGGARTPNSWFVGIVPRRNPELAIVVLQEHGDWGANSAHIAQAIVTTYVNKQRRQNHNLLQQAGENKPVEVGAVWSAPAGPDAHGEPAQADALHSGHFLVKAKNEAKGLTRGQESAAIRDPRSQNRDLHPKSSMGAAGGLGRPAFGEGQP
jgi:penicillin-binding protein 2